MKEDHDRVKGVGVPVRGHDHGRGAVTSHRTRIATVVRRVGRGRHVRTRGEAGIRRRGVRRRGVRVVGVPSGSVSGTMWAASSSDRTAPVSSTFSGAGESNRQREERCFWMKLEKLPLPCK